MRHIPLIISGFEPRASSSCTAAGQVYPVSDSMSSGRMVVYPGVYREAIYPGMYTHQDTRVYTPRDVHPPGYPGIA